MRVYETRVLAHGRATPLQPILELLREYFGIKSTDSKDEARQRVTGPARYCPLRTKRCRSFSTFWDWRSPASPPARSIRCKKKPLDPDSALSRAVQARRARGRILVEDLHWVDAASEVFIEALADAVVDTTTLLVLNFRPDFVAPWMQRSHYRQIGLADFSKPSARTTCFAAFWARTPRLRSLQRHHRSRAGQSLLH